MLGAKAGRACSPGVKLWLPAARLRPPPPRRGLAGGDLSEPGRGGSQVPGRRLPAARRVLQRSCGGERGCCWAMVRVLMGKRAAAAPGARV